jgi:large subunit ribosomal protein L19
MHQSALQYIQSKQERKDLTNFHAGDTVRVHWKVREGEKERVQPFEGVVIRKTRGSTHASFTVRKMSYGVGVERIFPLHSPRYESVEVLSHGAVNRSRLFYLRDLKGKASRVDTEETQAQIDQAMMASANAPHAHEAAPAEHRAEEKPAKAPKAEKGPKAEKAPKKK